jgi:prepilin-type N-terminal cleavage/methylation domain-containing protein
MLTRKGFTLIELAIVVLIVAILAAIALPLMRGRIDSAKWTEGKAMVGTIAVSLKTFAALHRGDYSAAKGAGDKYGPMSPTLAEIGIFEEELSGRYFKPGNYMWATSWDRVNQKFSYSITIVKGAGIAMPYSWTLDDSGNWISNDLAP